MSRKKRERPNIEVDALTAKVADQIGCTNDERCDVGWNWRKCESCIETAKGVITIVREEIANGNA